MCHMFQPEMPFWTWNQSSSSDDKIDNCYQVGNGFTSSLLGLGLSYIKNYLEIIIRLLGTRSKYKDTFQV